MANVVQGVEDDCCFQDGTERTATWREIVQIAGDAVHTWHAWQIDVLVLVHTLHMVQFGAPTACTNAELYIQSVIV